MSATADGLKPGLSDDATTYWGGWPVTGVEALRLHVLIYQQTERLNDFQ